MENLPPAQLTGGQRTLSGDPAHSERRVVYSLTSWKQLLQSSDSVVSLVSPSTLRRIGHPKKMDHPYSLQSR